jgi:YihY family inner membrane protein
MPQRIAAFSSQIQRTLRLAGARFFNIDGGQRAAAFAHNAFLALFPTILLAVSMVSALFGRAMAGRDVVNYIGKYLPSGGGLRRNVLGAIDGIVSARGEVGALVVIILIWAAAQFYITIVQATNQAWGEAVSKWWKKPLKALALLGIMVVAVLVGVAVPLLGNIGRSLLPANIFLPWVYSVLLFFVPWVVLFAGLSLFYKLAPYRRTRFSEVWAPALCATLLLQAAQNLFVLYLKHYSKLDLIYGALGGVIAMMLWIYVSGVIFIFCACLCAAQAEVFAVTLPERTK